VCGYPEAWFLPKAKNLLAYKNVSGGGEREEGGGEREEGGGKGGWHTAAYKCGGGERRR
jgi:hypothetical protein